MIKRTNPILIFLFFGLFGSIVVSSEVTLEQVRTAAADLQQIEQAFARQSAPGRLSILCIGRFVDVEQKELFCALLPEMAGKLETMLNEQQELKKRMEDYTGRDWEELYGETRIWSTCSRTVLQGQFFLSRTRFWEALCTDIQKNKILNSVIEICQSQESVWGGQEQILRVLALWQRGESKDGETLRVILHQMMVRSDLTEQARDQMLLLHRRFELFSEGPFVEELEGLFQKKLETQEDFEWALEYAFLEFGDSDDRPLEQIVETWPQAKPFVSLLLLEWCTDQFTRQGRAAALKWSSFVVSGLCEAVVGSEHPETYRPLIAELARTQEKPAVMLAMAETLVPSQPGQAIEYYLKAARLQRIRPDSSVEGAAAIAERAGRLGCRLYQENAGRNSGPALRALGDYLDLAGEKADPEILCAAVGIFAEQGQEDQSRKLLDLLAKSGGQQSIRAQMEMFRVRMQQLKNPQERKVFEEEWAGWIQSLDRESADTAELRRQAAVEYVQHLFSAPSLENAEKIVGFLEVEPRDGDPTLTYLYVQALCLLERYGQAVTVLGSVPEDCENGLFDLFVLEGFMDRLEEFTHPSGRVMEGAASGKAEQLRSCFDAGSRERDRADLVWAELAARNNLSSLQTGKQVDSILGRFEQSSKVEVFRCRGFRRMQQGRWEEALKDWQAVRAAYEPQDKTEKGRDWHWWGAKYYELVCYSRLPQDTAEDVSHAVEILRVLYEPPSACWQERLKELEGEKERNSKH